MSTLKVINLQNPSANTPAIVLDTNGNMAVNGGIAMSSSFLRNKVINGDMRIDQRNAGASVTPTTDGWYTLDRWRFGLSQASKVSIQQNAGGVTPPTGFTKYLGVTSLSAYTLLSTDYFILGTYLEGVNTADLAWGTASASSVTLSFWVRASITGTYPVVFRNNAYNRGYVATYTVNSANTWEFKTITIAGDTTGTWATDTNAGIRVEFSLGAGSSLNTTAGVWSSSALLISVSGAVSVVGTNAATWYVTGVQLEAGTVATPFERRMYGHELALCQRYYYRTPAGAGGGVGWAGSATAAVGVGAFPVKMRTTPTGLEQSGTASDYSVAYKSTGTACSSVPIYNNQTTTDSWVVLFTIASGLTAGEGLQCRSATANGYLGWSAEL